MGDTTLSPSRRSKMISFRVTPEEYARLEKNASGFAISDHIRLSLLDDSVVPRQTRGRHPVKDQTALAQILGLLGRTRVYANLNKLTHAANSGLITLTPEQEISLFEACADLREIRAYLMRALGKNGDQA